MRLGHEHWQRDAPHIINRLATHYLRSIATLNTTTTPRRTATTLVRFHFHFGSRYLYQTFTYRHFCIALSSYRRCILNYLPCSYTYLSCASHPMSMSIIRVVSLSFLVWLLCHQMANASLKHRPCTFVYIPHIERYCIPHTHLYTDTERQFPSPTSDYSPHTTPTVQSSPVDA